MKDNIYFLTDAHLGSGTDSAQRELDLANFLEAIEDDACTLFLLGDMFDFWFTYRRVVPKGYIRFLGALDHLVRSGTEIHYFIGNHDMWLFDYLQSTLGIVMHTQPETLLLQGRTITMGHGDGLDPHDRHYLFLRRMFRCQFNQKLFASVPPSIGMAIADRWSHQSRASHQSGDYSYRGDEQENIYQWCKQHLKEHPCDYYVFGHRHVAVERPINVTASDGSQRNATYVNVGEWISHRHYAILTNGVLQLKEY